MFRLGSRFRLLLVIFAILVPCAWLGTSVLLYSQNTLYLNNRWIVQKRMMNMGVMGGDEFVITRSPLAKNILDLGDWFGYQEVVSRGSLVPSKVEFRFMIPEKSFLSLSYNRGPSRYSGLILSRKADFPSLSYEGTTKGAISGGTQLSLPEFSSDWHHATLEATHSGLLLTIDGMPVHLPAARFILGSIGFRGGGYGAKIDHVVITTADQGVILESFTNSKHWLTGLALNSIILLILVLVMALFVRRGLGLDQKRLIFHCAALSIAGLLCGGLWYGFDFFYWSKIPSYVQIHRLNSESRPLPGTAMEQFRFHFFNLWYRMIGGETITHAGMDERGYPSSRTWEGPAYCGPDARGNVDQCHLLDENQLATLMAEKKTGYRVMFIGTSQTIGAGAETLDDTFFARIHRFFLGSGSHGFSSLESLNISVSGSESHKLFENYRKSYAKFSPDLVVINLSNNDATGSFEEGIWSFLSFNSSRGISTVLVQEANANSNQSLVSNHQTLKSLANRFKTPLVSFHDFLNQKKVQQSGFIWWDNVHLTSYGQEVSARWLAPILLEKLLGHPPKKQ